MEQKPPQLTVDEFYEKSEKLNEVYRHNVEAMNKEFFEKQKNLFDRLSNEDQEEVRKREMEKLRELQQQAMKIIAPDNSLVDFQGRKITTH